jgi:hypothetical protein
VLAGALTGERCGRWQHQAVKLVGVDQREPGQHPRVDPITFGMTLIVAAQVGDFLTVDQIDRHSVAGVIHGDWKPGHAGRFHHDLHLGERCTIACSGEQEIQIVRSRVDSQDRGTEAPALVQDDRFMSGLDGQVETNRAAYSLLSRGQ